MKYRCKNCGMMSGELPEGGSPAALPEDPVARVGAIKALMDNHRAEIHKLAQGRAQTVCELVTQYGQTKTAELLGVSVGLIYKLMNQVEKF